MTWIVAPGIARLRADINAVAASRDTASDGTIGDYAHSLHPSSHNPDDTPGSLAEYSDSDNIAEVRGLDIDTDLHEQFTLLDLVKSILASPEDRVRLRYIIHNRTIWSKSAGWVGQYYSGDDPHTNHAHFSGDPAYDADDSPWQSVLRFKEENDMTPEEGRKAAFLGTYDAWYQMASGSTTEGRFMAGQFAKVTTPVVKAQVDPLRVEVAGLRSLVEQLAQSGTSVDVSAVLAAIDTAKAEIRAETRDAVADLGEGGAAQVRADQG